MWYVGVCVCVYAELDIITGVLIIDKSASVKTDWMMKHRL